MKLSHVNFEMPFDMNSQSVNVLVVEDEKDYYDYCYELYRQSQGESGNFVLSNGINLLPILKSAAVVHNYFEFGINDKRFISKLYQRLQEIAEERFLTEVMDIQSAIGRLFQKLDSESDFPLDHDLDVATTNLFKLYGIKLSEDTQSLLARVLDFVRVAVLLAGAKCIFFVGIKNYLTTEELLQLYHETRLLDIPVFLIENTLREKLAGENIRIIDRDKCEIIV